jgi:hypothetical protein
LNACIISSTGYANVIFIVATFLQFLTEAMSPQWLAGVASFVFGTSKWRLQPSPPIEIRRDGWS